MLEMGIVVAFGLLFILAKLSWRWKLRLISNPILVDVSIFTLLTMLHWGTYAGVMVATVGALFCSMTLSIAKWLFGHIESNKYIPGKIDVRNKI